MTTNAVPFFRPDIGEDEVTEVTATLRSGWLTTGPRVAAFEEAFRESVGATHALAVNSCTAALHLALEAHGVTPGQAVLVPTLTFAATAAVVRHLGAVPILVDCDPVTTNMNLADAALKLEQLRSGNPPAGLPRDMNPVGMVVVHVGGLMMNVREVREFAKQHGLWVVEDAAHAFPAAWRPALDAAWQRCGEGTAAVTCYSFYANKTITTGEGGMALTNDPVLLERMRLMALHGLSRSAWDRYKAGGSWDYRVIAPGYKYNLTDIAAAIGIHQLRRAEFMRRERETVARQYLERLRNVEEIELPPEGVDRIHSWHLFPLKLRLEKIAIDQAEFIVELGRRGIACSVHWRPLHLHPYYQTTFGWRPEDLPVATASWPRFVSLPIFSGMRPDEVDQVVAAVKEVCACQAKTPSPAHRVEAPETLA